MTDTRRGGGEERAREREEEMRKGSCTDARVTQGG